MWFCFHITTPFNLKKLKYKKVNSQNREIFGGKTFKYRRLAKFFSFLKHDVVYIFMKEFAYGTVYFFIENFLSIVMVWVKKHGL